MTPAKPMPGQADLLVDFLPTCGQCGTRRIVGWLVGWHTETSYGDDVPARERLRFPTSTGRRFRRVPFRIPVCRKPECNRWLSMRLTRYNLPSGDCQAVDPTSKVEHVDDPDVPYYRQCGCRTSHGHHGGDLTVAPWMDLTIHLELKESHCPATVLARQEKAAAKKARAAASTTTDSTATSTSTASTESPSALPTPRRRRSTEASAPARKRRGTSSATPKASATSTPAPGTPCSGSGSASAPETSSETTDSPTPTSSPRGSKARRSTRRPSASTPAPETTTSTTTAPAATSSTPTDSTTPPSTPDTDAA